MGYERLGSDEEFIPVGASTSIWSGGSGSHGQEHLAGALEDYAEGVDKLDAEDIAQLGNTSFYRSANFMVSRW